MNIDRSRELLYDYAHGKLSDQERCDIEAQLLNSEDLRIELKKITSYYAAIDEIDPVPVPDRFLEKVHQRIELREKRSLFARLLYPLHSKLPIELAGVAATVVLVIFIFIPQLEKKNYSVHEPVIFDKVTPEPSASKDEMAGQPGASISVTEETVSEELGSSAKKEISVNKDKRPVSSMKQLPKKSVPKAIKRSPTANAGVKKVDEVKSMPAAEQLSENVPGSVPVPVPEPARQSVTENNEMDKSQYAAAMAPVEQENELQKSFSESEEQASEPGRKAASFKQKRMRARSAYSERVDAKEGASTVDLETVVSKKITALLAKYKMKCAVKEFTGHTSNCSASGTPAAVTSFLREIKELPDVSLLKVIPENYSAALDSVIVEFTVKGKME